jgi:hypothetical protein
MASYAEFLRLARDPAAGIELREGIELLARADSAPGWRAGLDGYREARGEELPADLAERWIVLQPPWRSDPLIARVVGPRVPDQVEPTVAHAGVVDGSVGAAGFAARRARHSSA